MSELMRLAERADELGAGGARRDVLEVLVLQAANYLIDEMYEAGNRREETARALAERVMSLVGSR